MYNIWNFAMTFSQLQADVAKWAAHNFPNTPSHRPLLGAMEEIGELSHAHLKMDQCIRGSHAEHMAAKSDAVGDTIIYLSHYCQLNGIDLQLAVETAWAEVKQRDWIKFPKNGRSE